MMERAKHNASVNKCVMGVYFLNPFAHAPASTVCLISGCMHQGVNNDLIWQRVLCKTFAAAEICALQSFAAYLSRGTWKAAMGDCLYFAPCACSHQHSM